MEEELQEKRYKIEKLRDEKGYHNVKIVAGFVSFVILQYILNNSNITRYNIEEFNSILSELPYKKMLLQEMTHTLTREECEQFVYDKLYQYCL